MPVGAIISGAASIGSALIGSHAAGQAGQYAQQAAQQGNQLIGNQMSANNSNLDPWVQSGQNYNSALEGLLGVGGDPAAAQRAWQNYLNSTNYQFRLGQGLQGIEYANAPAFSSSATAKALNNYAQGEAGNALQGYENMLMGGSSLGAQTGLGLGQLNMQGAEQQSANLLAAAGVQGSAAMAGANAWQNALHGLTSAASSFGQGMGGGGNVSTSLASPQTAGYFDPGALQSTSSFDTSGLSTDVPAAFG